MNHDDDLRALDFHHIRRRLERLALTPYGKEAAARLGPAPTLAGARAMQTAVGVARSMLAESPLVLEDLPQVRPALRQAGAAGATLRPAALANLTRVLRAGRQLARRARDWPGLYPGDAGDLKPAPALLERLQATVTPSGALRDDASETLARLTRAYLAQRAEAEAQLRAFQQRPELVEVVDDCERVHWQGDRVVMRVSARHVERIRGRRAGSHMGGRDELVEPLALVAANDRTERLCAEVSAEQQRLLREVTEQVRAHLPALERLLEAITWIDLAVAGARLAQCLDARPPELVDEPGLALTAAYHPLLLLQHREEGAPRPVPLTLALDADERLTVVTGPNTGGKTVALKTVGLLATMALCGLHLPAEGPCRVGAYRRILVDVGDHQSLYHHLSTFAGHVEVLKRVLAAADAHALVLLDELGTGTDPEEGAALAMAVLDELVGRGVQGIINTHLAPLKEYAARTPHVRNASMRFDHDNLRPIYELQIGVPGASLGLVVAGTQGLPEALVDRARRYLDAIRGA